MIPSQKKPFLYTISILAVFGIFSVIKAHQGFSTIVEAAASAVTNISITQNLKRHQNYDCDHEPSADSQLDDLEELPSDLNEPPESPHKIESSGSGFVVKSDPNSAYIVTNYHVIADADKITVFLNDQTELEAAVLGVDQQADLAVLKVNTTHLPTDRRKLAALDWADSSKLKVGDFVLAIGNSLGMRNSTSHGIISNLARRLTGSPYKQDYSIDFIQHSAGTHKGNSGGPLLNLDGKVIGINTAIFSPNGENIGIGLSIPSTLAKERIAQLIEFGRIRNGWLGIRTQAQSGDAFNELGLDPKKSYKIVSSVSPSGPGAKAMIKAGDVILEFDGHEVNDKTTLTQMIRDTPVGKTVKIKLWRAGQFLTVEAILEDLETPSSSHPSCEGPTRTKLVNT